ncbi:serine protease inhibitor Kazal-type 12-like [Pollicipes pollicipes]|uniref:serine protease inhibitor Kazal-type 12-like n=1 Tax=Pollicipes pollicipes TaxID=41117 RepID=UPI0018854D3F|nr:serine protease inhibitor Kazal-type 12-like [Pollicipes pollicipes]
MIHLFVFGALVSVCSAAQKPCSFPNTEKPVCATDGNTYMNMQELECLAMERRRVGLEEIFVRHDGRCDAVSHLNKRTSYGRFSWVNRPSSGVKPAASAVALLAAHVVRARAL